MTDDRRVAGDRVMRSVAGGSSWRGETGYACRVVGPCLVPTCCGVLCGWLAVLPDGWIGSGVEGVKGAGRGRRRGTVTPRRAAPAFGSAGTPGPAHPMAPGPDVR